MIPEQTPTAIADGSVILRSSYGDATLYITEQ